MDRPAFTASGRTVFRNGEPIAEATTDDLARAIALTFDDARLLFYKTPIADQEFVDRTVWPDLRELTREPDAELVGGLWEE